MPVTVSTLFFATLCCQGMGLALSGLGHGRTARGGYALALVTAASCLCALARAGGHWPVFHLFESLLAAAWIVQCWLVSRPGHRLDATMPGAWAAGLAMLLLGICLFLDQEVSAGRFNHGYPWVIGFHGFRVASLAALLLASAHFLAGRRLLKTAGAKVLQTLHSGRNYLLSAAVLFLTAEYCGLVWCQNGWGDIWHWSPGFFQSTLILLYLMAAFHVPAKWAHARRVRTFLGVMGGFFVLGMMLLRSLI